MLRRHVPFAMVVCLGIPGIGRADEFTKQTPSSSDTAKQAEFVELVHLGDLARFAGRNREAVALYHSALEIQRDPVIQGRLGLVLIKLGQLDRAAADLKDAVTRGQNTDAAERVAVFAAYDKAKLATTLVNVDISHAGAKVTYDGSPRNPGGFSAFWMFALPGEHTLRATLDGYDDAVATFTAKPGDEITISLKLVPRGVSKLPELPAPVAVSPDKRVYPPLLPTSNIPGDSNYDPREDPSYGEPKEKPVQKKNGPRISVTGGVVTVFGVASWNPAVGPVIGVSVKPKEFFSLGLEGRAAWLTTDVVSQSQISAMTAGGIVSACARWKWFFGCGLGHVGAMNVAFSERSYTGKTYTEMRLGVGGRVGGQVHVSDSLLVTGSVDAFLLSRGSQVAVGNQIIVDIPPLFVGGQVMGEWEFSP